MVGEAGTGSWLGAQLACGVALLLLHGASPWACVLPPGPVAGPQREGAESRHFQHLAFS